MAYVRDRLNGFCTDLGIELAELRGAPIPVGDDVLLETGDDICLVGDAAGLIDAGTGPASIMRCTRLAPSLPRLPAVFRMSR